MYKQNAGKSVEHFGLLGKSNRNDLTENSVATHVTLFIAFDNNATSLRRWPGKTRLFSGWNQKEKAIKMNRQDKILFGRPNASSKVFLQWNHVSFNNLMELRFMPKEAFRSSSIRFSSFIAFHRSIFSRLGFLFIIATSFWHFGRPSNEMTCHFPFSGRLFLFFSLCRNIKFLMMFRQLVVHFHASSNREWFRLLLCQ